MTTEDFTQFMKELELSTLKNEEMQKHETELFCQRQTLAPRSRVISIVYVLKIILDNYKWGINECAKTSENILKRPGR